MIAVDPQDARPALTGLDVCAEDTCECVARVVLFTTCCLRWVPLCRGCVLTAWSDLFVVECSVCERPADVWPADSEVAA